MKKTKFEKIQKHCIYGSICDCGQSELCDHVENPDGFCEVENCPKLKKRKQ
jgi:hypothetical protein